MTPEIFTPGNVATVPQLLAATDEDAIALVNRWLHREVGMALHADRATFNSTTFCWHLPVLLAYGSTGPLGVVGDVYLHAATGAFIGVPTVAELQRRADELAAAHGIEE